MEEDEQKMRGGGEARGGDGAQFCGGLRTRKENYRIWANTYFMSRAGPAIVPSEKCVRVSAPFSLAARSEKGR